MRIWQMAGLSSENVKQAAVVNWMILGVYFTQEFLHKMKKIKSPLCLGCEGGEIENLNHIILHCGHYQTIREAYLPEHFAQNKCISEVLDVEENIILSILDPLSSKLPDTVVRNCLLTRSTNYPENSATTSTERGTNCTTKRKIYLEGFPATTIFMS